MIKSIGIDLGTTNSVVATIIKDQPYIIINSDKLRTTPSIITYTTNQKLLIGNIAKRQAIINPENTFFSIKRFLGLKKHEIPFNVTNLSYTIVETTDNKIKIKCPILDKNFSPEEIYIQILRKLIKDTKNYLKENIIQTVISIPVYFNILQRQTIINAGKIIGIQILQIINESTAACLGYNFKEKKVRKYLVFNLGGGTLDISILNVNNGIFEIITTIGDVYLGGDDFDNNIILWLVDFLKIQENIDVSKNIQILQRLRNAVEKAKIELSTCIKTKISLPYLISDLTKSKHLEIEISRSLFESLNKNLIQKCFNFIEKVLKKINFKKTDAYEVILAGGSIRIPIIKNFLGGIMLNNLNYNYNPDEIVSLGAAFQANNLIHKKNDILILDAISLSLGVETIGGTMTKIINKDTTIPITKSQFFSILPRNKKFNIKISIYQGEYEFTVDNKFLSVILFNNIKLSNQVKSLIEVKFIIDINGILSVIINKKTI